MVRDAAPLRRPAASPYRCPCRGRPASSRCSRSRRRAVRRGRARGSLLPDAVAPTTATTRARAVTDTAASLAKARRVRRPADNPTHEERPCELIDPHARQQPAPPRRTPRPTPAPTRRSRPVPRVRDPTEPTSPEEPTAPAGPTSGRRHLSDGTGHRSRDPSTRARRSTATDPGRCRWAKDAGQPEVRTMIAPRREATRRDRRDRRTRARASPTTDPRRGRTSLRHPRPAEARAHSARTWWTTRRAPRSDEGRTWSRPRTFLSIEPASRCGVAVSWCRPQHLATGRPPWCRCLAGTIAGGGETVSTQLPRDAARSHRRRGR